MKSEGRLFFVLALFVFAIGRALRLVDQRRPHEQTGHRGIEWIGVVALVLSGLLLSMMRQRASG